MKVAYIIIQPDLLGGPLTFNKYLAEVVNKNNIPGLEAELFTFDWLVDTSLMDLDKYNVKIISDNDYAKFNNYDIVHFTSHIGYTDCPRYKKGEPIRWVEFADKLNTKVVVTVHDKALTDCSWASYMQERSIFSVKPLAGLVYWRDSFRDISKVAPHLESLPSIEQRPFLPDSVLYRTDIVPFAKRPKSFCYFGRPVTNKGMSRIMRELPQIKDHGYEFNAYVAYQNIFWMNIKKFEGDSNFPLIDELVKDYTTDEMPSYLNKNQFYLNCGWNLGDGEKEPPEWVTLEALASGLIPVISEHYGNWLKDNGFYCFAHKHHPKYAEYHDIISSLLETLENTDINTLAEKSQLNIDNAKKVLKGEDMLKSYMSLYERILSE